MIQGHDSVLTHLKTQHILKNNHLKSTKLVTTPFQLRLLQVAIGGMAIISVIWLGYEFWRLLFQDFPLGAIDLRLRHKEVAHWFSGSKVYYTIGTAIYPPASYALFWPFTGWLSLWKISAKRESSQMRTSCEMRLRS